MNTSFNFKLLVDQGLLMTNKETLLDGFNETERSDIYNYLDRMRDSAKNNLWQKEI